MLLEQVISWPKHDRDKKSKIVINLPQTLKMYKHCSSMVWEHTMTQFWRNRTNSSSVAAHRTHVQTAVVNINTWDLRLVPCLYQEKQVLHFFEPVILLDTIISLDNVQWRKLYISAFDWSVGWRLADAALWQLAFCQGLRGLDSLRVWSPVPVARDRGSKKLSKPWRPWQKAI